MRFEDFKNEFNHARAQHDLMEQAGRREWIAPELFVLDIRVAVFNDETNVYLNVRKWHRDPNATCDVAGRRFQGGYFDFVHRPLDELSPRELEQIAFAKMQIERWIAGELKDLPEQLWV